MIKSWTDLVTDMHYATIEEEYATGGNIKVKIIQNSLAVTFVLLGSEYTGCQTKPCNCVEEATVCFTKLLRENEVQISDYEAKCFVDWVWNIKNEVNNSVSLSMLEDGGNLYVPKKIA